MAKTPFAKRDEQHELTRRSLIQWTVAAGAALGVSKAKVTEILEKVGGKELAFASSENAATKAVHMSFGNGGASWATLLWPLTDIADANDPNLSYHKPGQTVNVAGTDRPLRRGPDTPFATLPPSQQITGFVCGRSSAHTNAPDVTLTNLNNNDIFAVSTALQSSNSSVIPVVVLNGLTLGTAPGAASPTAIGNSSGITGLFNSAASRAGGLLSKSQDATAYAVQYAAFAQLNRAAGRSTQKGAYGTAIGAAGLLGTNLSAQLTITAADMTRYGLSGSTPNNVKEIGNTLILAVKAFRMGLTQTILMPAMLDDPHGAFADGRVNTIPAMLKTIFDAFMTDLQTTTDTVTNKRLADDTVITISGDTPKDWSDHSGGNWGDGTPGGANLLWIYSAGHLKTGWNGDGKRNGTVTGYDAAGNAAPYNAANTSKYALASVAYAVARRDDRLSGQFANGIAVSGIFGVPKLL